MWGLITVPVGYLYMLLFALMIIVQITMGGIAFDQMWTRQALNNATSAAATQVSSDGSALGGSQVTTSDAQTIANEVWNAQNQVWTPSGQPIQATFTTSANNPDTPPGQYDSITGTAMVQLQENGINNFINTLSKQNNANFGGTLTDTVSSSLPSSLQ